VKCECECECDAQDALKLNKFSFTVESGVEEVRAALGGLDGGVGDKVILAITGLTPTLTLTLGLAPNTQP